jgi:hypothetical protein
MSIGMRVKLGNSFLSGKQPTDEELGSSKSNTASATKRGYRSAKVTWHGWWRHLPNPMAVLPSVRRQMCSVVPVPAVAPMRAYVAVRLYSHGRLSGAFRRLTDAITSFCEAEHMSKAISSYSVEARTSDGETVWVAIRARGAEWSWLTPAEAAGLGQQWAAKYGNQLASGELVMIDHRRLGVTVTEFLKSDRTA